MKNDRRKFEFDMDFEEITIDGEFADIIDYPKYIGAYIKEFNIDRVGNTIVMNNARHMMTEPSGAGTMRNLYRLYFAFFMENPEYFIMKKEAV